MSLAIEIKNNEVILVDAKVTKNRIQVKSTHSFGFEESMINQQGIVDSDNFSLVLSQQLSQFKSREKNCNVCINNNSIIYREILVPKVDEKRLPFLVRSEMMSALHLTPDYLVDYVPLEEVERDGHPMYRVLAVAILEVAIESYLKTLKKANLKVNTIDTVTNSIIKLVDTFGLSKTESQFIVADVQKGQLKLYLFDEGVYVLARNTKLTSNLDEEAMNVDEIIESISKMNQFTFTRNNKGINHIIYLGLDSVLKELSNGVEETLNIPGKIFNEVINKDNQSSFENKHVNAIGVLLRK
ncbi:MAG: pilus assembly protein PilM [Erysipelothrix sp.]|jgi:type IV pilus assembly protein PilM|nr:pilus assembly protein PilM [Erysipelothrix sp.]